MDGTFPGCVDDRMVVRFYDNKVFLCEIAHAVEMIRLYVSQVFHRVDLCLVLLDDAMHCNKL